MTKMTLSVDQMKNLEKLGLDISDSSMIYVKCPVSGVLSGPQVNEGQYEYGDLYTYTLQDILGKLDPIFRKMVIGYEPEEWLDIAYSKLCFQITHKDETGRY